MRKDNQQRKGSPASPPPTLPYIITSKGLWAQRERLSALLQAPIIYKPSPRALAAQIPPPIAVLAWGKKASSQSARTYATKHQIPLARIEDGFLRSLDLGFRVPPLAINLDDDGIYYDATTPSRLERHICRPLDASQIARARHLREQWCKGRVSKYNHAREYTAPLPANYILVVDQTAGDISISAGLANADSFLQMLQTALDENPASQILLKTHPDVVNGHKKGHFNLEILKQNPRITLIATDAHPVRLIEHAEKVYTVTSQMGFEALLWNKPVHCFGMPFYAGWGLTTDTLPPPEHRQQLRRQQNTSPVTIESLVHAALIDYPRYIHPETLQPCEVEPVLEWMSLQRTMRERFPPQLHALGFSLWKQPILRDFLAGSKITFITDPATIPDHATAVIWGRKFTIPDQESREIKALHIEDGFLRSVGLGAELVRPLSWAIDTRGIYYDCTCPSDMEHILATTEFSDELRARAAALRTRIVTNDLTKYNLKTSYIWQRPDTASKVILVVGQVESDASLAYGAPDIRTAREVLHAARTENPDAHIIYKPHPDVVAGLRPTGQGESDISHLCNEIIANGSISQMIAAADEVHVLTSLAGFEALLRGKKVITYGQPFYAGWGLTVDKIPHERRTRNLTLDELVAGALILYPTYVSRASRCFTTPERALDELLGWRDTPIANKLPLWRKLWRKFLGLAMRYRT